MPPFILNLILNKYTAILAIVLCVFFYWKFLTNSLEKARKQSEAYESALVVLEKELDLIKKQNVIKERELEKLANSKAKTEKVFVDRIKRIKEIEKIYVDGSCSLSPSAVQLQHEAADDANAIQGGRDSK